jgi:hypothetical protein
MSVLLSRIGVITARNERANRHQEALAEPKCRTCSALLAKAGNCSVGPCFDERAQC